jgi:hypothetical protein
MKGTTMTKCARILSLFTLLGTLSAIGAAERQTKSPYQNIQIHRFDVQSGVDFPADYLATMMEDLVEQIDKTQLFKQVLRQGESPAEANTSTVQLVGNVVRFNKGSRATRYIVGFGAGTTKVVAHIKLVDSVSGEVKLEADVDGKVVIGFIGGDSMGATRGLAKEVAKVIKKKF